MFALCLLICGLWVQETIVRPDFPVRFERGGKWGYTNGQGEVIIKPRYLLASDFTAGGIAAVVDSGGWLYIDRQGRELLRPFVLDNGPDYFVEDLARFVSNGKIGFFDRRGTAVIPAQFAFALPFSEGRAAVCAGCKLKRDGEHFTPKGGKWGYIDPTGAVIIAIQFEQAESFRNGRARVKSRRSWSVIDVQGRLSTAQ